MNYFALNPNFSMPMPQTAQNFASRSLIQNQLVIRAIASALSNSLNNYQNTIIAAKNAAETNKQTSIQPIPENPVARVQETASLKLAQMPLPLQKQNKNVLIQKSEIPKVKTEKKSKETQALTTSQEVIPEKLQKPALIKQEKNRKKSISGPCKPQPLKPSKVPTIDMIETAYLPAKRLNAPQIDKMREQLLLRQVEQWNDKIKCRRDKRQLRLLNE